jgi:hypothetical protein
LQADNVSRAAGRLAAVRTTFIASTLLDRGDQPRCAAMKTLPKITIISPCRNGARFLAEAIESVARQNYPNVEHLVFDALSTDSTPAILARYPALTVVSEADESAHEAMNKGLARAKGDVIGFLNVDDRYPEGTLIEVGRKFAACPDIDVVRGPSILFDSDAAGNQRELLRRSHRRDAGWSLPELTFGAPGFNGCFLRRTLFERVGAFEIGYLFAADRHFMIRAALAGCKVARIDRPTICFRVHENSRTLNRGRVNAVAISREYLQMAAEFSARPSVAPAQRRVFLAWHAFEGAKLLARHVAEGRFPEALERLRNLTKHDPPWPLRLGRALLLRRQARRHCAA